jgi:hypothetical protein
MTCGNYVVEITLAASLAEIGEVSAEPNDNLIVPSLAIDEAAMLEKKECSMKTVGLTCTTGTPDQLRICSQSQCCCCHLRNVDENLKVGDSRIVAYCCGCRNSRSLDETLMPKYIRLQPCNALATSAPFVRSATTSSAPISLNA